MFGQVGEEMDQPGKGLPFAKMHGNGNDFVVIDNRSGDIPEKQLPGLALRLCRRRTSIGADGLMAVEKSEKGDFRMRLFNRDGSEGEMCGNGARCLARYAFEKGIAPGEMTIETLAGLVGARVEGSFATLDMGTLETASVLRGQELTLSGERFLYSQLTVGVPHTVIFQAPDDGREEEELARVARVFQSDGERFPRGTNVNFMKVRGGRALELMTYERGVEGITLSCGTGSAAGAVAAWLEGEVSPPVEVHNPGGVNTVLIEEEGPGVVRLFLKGETVLVAEGVLWDE